LNHATTDPTSNFFNTLLGVQPDELSEFLDDWVRNTFLFALRTASWLAFAGSLSDHSFERI